MRKILITGGAGNIAGSLANLLAEDANNYIVIVDNLLTGSKSKLPTSKNENWHFIKTDVNNYEAMVSIMSTYKFDYVFHYAAVVGVKRTLDNPLWVLEDIKGIENILRLSKNTGVKKVFYSSSSEVYGEPFEIPQNEETTPLNSRLPYAIVKNVGEAYFNSYYREFGLNYTIFRFFNTYGPKQSSDFVLSKFLDLALQNKPITIYGDGSQTRTFCYIDDNLKVTKDILYNDLANGKTLNIGSDFEISIMDLAIKVKELTKSSSEIVSLPPLKEGDMTRRKPDISKMKVILGKELISLEEGISKLIDLKKNSK
jgi:UDP-glucose 4-epimerase